jgi:hypothetical protein
VGVGVIDAAGGTNLTKTNKMRVTHTPFKTKTRAIGSDLEMTLALLGALRNPKQSKLSKLGKIATTLTKLFK